MADEYYYINGDWVTWAAAHNMGYTKAAPTIINAVYADLTPVEVRRDAGDGTYWTADLQSWVATFAQTNTWVAEASSDFYYMGESRLEFPYYRGAGDRWLYDGALYTFAQLHDQFGVTTYACEDWLMQGGVVIAWYDAESALWWDDRVRAWTAEEPVIEGGGSAMPMVEFAPILDEVMALPCFEVAIPDLSDKHTVFACVYEETSQTWYIGDENGATIQGVAYAYGDPVTVNVLVYSQTDETLVKLYTSAALFGDANQHSQAEFDVIVAQYTLVQDDPNA